MLKKLLLLLTLANQLVGDCGKGCLKCSATDTCQVCDLSSFYILQEKTCQKADAAYTDFCQVIDFAGKCSFCQPSYYLDAGTKKCVAVETAKLIDKCENYDSAQTCLNCQEKFRFEGGECVANTANITNCIRQDSETTCLVCSGGYILSSTRETCSALPVISNCLYVSKYKCQQCSAGFIFNPNLFSINLLRVDTEVHQSAVLGLLTDEAQDQTNYLNQQVCQTVTVENCLETSDYKTCSVCNPGYFLTDDNKCKAFPVDKILNCRRYSSNTVCIECEQGFVLLNTITCSKITQEQAKLNCTQHDPTTANINCTKCKEGFVLANNSCNERLNLVDNCLIQGENKDNHCEECQSGFVPNNTETLCGPSIANCIQHINVTETVSECDICKVGFYLNENSNPASCVPGTKDHCKVYQQKQNQCAECNPGYFLNDANLCIKHINIINCKDFSLSNRDQCDTCVENYYPFTVEEICIQKDVIHFCTGYDLDAQSSTSTCNACIEGKKLVVNPTSQCVDITIDHCLIVDGTGKCTKCEEGYGLNLQDPLHSCEIIPVYVSQNCLTLVDAQDEEFQKIGCEVCEDNAYRVDLSDKQVCIETDKWSKLPDSANKSIVQNCDMYDSDFMCVKCIENYFLDTSNACDSTCDGTVYVKDDEKINVCDTLVDKNKIATRVNNATKIIECKTELRVIDLEALSFANYNPSTSKRDPIFPFQLHIDSCPDFVENTTEVNGVAQSASGMNNFQYVFEDGNNGDALTGLRCKWGKTGAGDDLGDCGQTIVGCDPNVKYEISRETAQLNYIPLVACHKCNDNKTPVVFFNADVNGTGQDFIRYRDFTFDDEDWSTGTNHNHHFCVDFSQTQAQLQTELAIANTQTINTVDNCGHYAMLGGFQFGAAFVNSDIAAATNTNATNQMICIYCKPGFKPTYQDNKVTACAAMDKCDATSTMINGCNKCVANHYHPYDSQNDDIVLHDNCIPVDNASTPIPNCLAIDDTTTECKVCNKGWVLDNDGHCVKFTYNNCEDGYWNDLIDDENFASYYAGEGVGKIGCSKCKAGFFSITEGNATIGLPDQTCYVNDFGLSTKGTHVQTIEVTPADSEFVDFCRNYKNNAAPICKVCQDGYLLATEGNNTRCYPVGDNANCKTLGGNQTNADCVACEAGFGLIPGANATSVCSKVSIANCKTYNTALEQPTVQCVVCEDGYSLKNNICTLGKVEECKVFGNEIYICEECQPGFILIDESKIQNRQFAGSTVDTFLRSYCIRGDDYLNCKVATLNGNNKLVCTTCKEPSYIKKTVTPPDNNASNDQNSLCLNYHAIDNCVEYYDGTSLSESNFSCLRCENATHFRDDKGYACTKRTVLDPMTKDFQVSANLIESCIDNFFVKSGSQQCLPFPDGIIGCVDYENQTTCLQCNDERYLSVNECKLVTEKVSNCSRYSADLICSACKENFYLNKLDTANDKGQTHECVTAISNCLTQTSTTICAKCLPGYNLNEEKKVCTVSAKTNCSVFESDTDTCKVCIKDYYRAVDGSCTVVPNDKKIVECLQQASETTCALCSVGFALQADGAKCNESFLDTNCQVQSQPDGGNCSICATGYHFDGEGVCTADENRSDGCFTNKPGLEDCFICKPSHYMNDSQECKLNQTPPGPKEEGSRIKELVYVLLLLLF